MISNMFNSDYILNYEPYKHDMKGKKMQCYFFERVFYNICFLHNICL